MIIDNNLIHLSIKGIHIDYPEGGSIVKGINLQLYRGKIGCLLGPSGCGKSTILRAICGFEHITAGEIFLDNRVVSSRHFVLSPEKRRIGIVFQDYALFPHLNNIQNVAFGLMHLPKKTAFLQAEEWLSRVGLHGIGHRYPHELSGGQQQRVALARAMAPKPEILLLDEPFSNLDIDLREKIASEVRDILKSNKTTALLVTHDQFEAFAIADDIGIIVDGQLIEWNNAYDIYHKPTTHFTASFLGHSVFIPGVIQKNAIIETELGNLSLSQCVQYQIGTIVDVLLRADDVVHDDQSLLQAEVLNRVFRGEDFLYKLKLQSGQKIMMMIPSHHNHFIGEKIGIRLVADHVIIFPKSK